MAKAYSANKVSTDNTNGFNETTQWTLLMCSNVNANANKFYMIELQFNKDTNEYRIFSHYGRLAGEVADGGVFDVRGPDTDLDSLKKEYDKIVKHKEKGKTKKNEDGSSYKEQYVKVDVLQPTVGSPNIRKSNGSIASANVARANNSDLGDKFKDFGDQERKILTQLLKENIHNITTSTSVTMTANGLETPLGPLTLDHIAKARSVLDNLKGFIPTDGSSANTNDRDFRHLNSQAFSLVPRPFRRGYTIQDSDMLFNMNKLLAEYDLLNEMESTIQITSNTDDNVKKHDFGFSMNLADKATTDALFHYVNSTRRHHQLDNWKPVRVYEVENSKERSRFLSMEKILANKGKNATINAHANGDGKNIISDYDTVDLFHGSKNSNILSIMLNGFYIPPVNSPLVCGRMMGQGIYGANSSTKSLNYSLGNWSSGGMSGGNGRGVRTTFLFITKFAMGKIYRTTGSLYNGAPSGYDSIYAAAGRSLVNDEFIVPKVDQSTITHLIELENRF